MLKSYDYKLKSDLNKSIIRNIFIVTITDDDFEDTVEIANIVKSYSGIIVPAIIKVYEARSLNVVKNLMRYFVKDKKIFDSDIKNNMNHCSKLIPEYQKYHEELQNYLILV